MESLIQILTDWGYAGLFLSALLAGSIVPFSSELVMAGLVAMGLKPWLCVLSASLGNTLGGLTCYWLGRLGRTDWIEKYLGVKPEKVEKMQRFLQGRGALMAFFAFLPFVGEAIAVALGFMRSNLVLTILSMFAGKLARYVVMLLALMGVLSSCTPPKAATDKPVVTVSIEPVRYFTEAVAGDRFQVSCLVPKGASPETYDPTPRQLAELSESRAWLRTGYLGFEVVWAERLTANMPKLQVVDLSDGIELIRDTLTVEHASHDHFHHTGGVEPHIWNSASNARQMTIGIAQALSRLDPSGETLYRQRCDSLCRVISRTDSLCRVLLSRPKASHAFMIYHPALSYFARDYGLVQIPIEAGGKEPTPAYLKELMETCREQQVRVIFVQPEFDRRNAEQIARQTGARVVDVNPLAYDWQAEMLHVARTLAGEN